MKASEESVPDITLEQWCVNARASESVLRIRIGDEALCLAHRESQVRWCLAAGWHGLLALRPGLQVISGEAWVRPLSHANFVKMQFFIDKGGVVRSQAVRGEPWATLSEEGRDQSVPILEAWYLKLALQGGAAYQVFARQLRCSESYQLLDFLLEQGSSGEKLQDLAGRYGVSISHFRRLCNQALGGPAKSTMREWRAARALLAIAEKSGSLTDVAMQLGYASSSHFSKDLRELLGVAPAGLIDITRLSSERVNDV